MKHRPFVLAAILALASSTQLSQQNAPQTNVGTIRGVVTREGTSEPLSDVLISLLGPAAPGRGTGGFDAQGGVGLMTARTDRTGRFMFGGIPQGVYTLRAELEGYFGPSTGSGYSTFASRSMTVSRASEDVTLSLVQGGVISGRALDVNGRPALGSSVQALRLVYRDGASRFQSDANSPVDDRGEYRLFRLPPGQYYVCLYPSQTLGRGFGGRGARGASGSVPPTYYPDTSDPLRALSVEVTPGDERTGINLNFTPTTTVRISGRVISNVAIPGRATARGESALPAAQLSLVSRDPRIPINPGARGLGSVQLNEPNSGRFEMNGVVPGDYDLFATVLNANAAAASAIDEPRYFAGRLSLDVGQQDLENVAIVIGQSVALKVRVTVNESAAVPPETIRIQIQAADTAASLPAYNPAVPLAQAAVNSQGEFTIPFVNEGLYRLQAVFTPFGAPRGQRGAQPQIEFLDAYVADVRQGGSSVYDSGLRVGTRDLGPVEVLVKTNGGTVDGVVSDALGNPQVGATVVLAPPESRRQNPGLYKTATTYAAGRFTMRGIPPGSHKLFAWASIPSGAYQNPEFISKDEQRGRQILVNASSTTNAELTLITSTPR